MPRMEPRQIVGADVRRRSCAHCCSARLLTLAPTAGMKYPGQPCDEPAEDLSNAHCVEGVRGVGCPHNDYSGPVFIGRMHEEGAAPDWGKAPLEMNIRGSG